MEDLQFKVIGGCLAAGGVMLAISFVAHVAQAIK